MNVKQLQEKLHRHQAYYDAKFAEYKQMDISSTKSFKRYRRLNKLSVLISKLILELTTEMMIAVFSDDDVDFEELEREQLKQYDNKIVDHDVFCAMESSPVVEYVENIEKKHCEHINNETIPIRGTLETITICHDCGCEL